MISGFDLLWTQASDFEGMWLRSQATALRGSVLFVYLGCLGFRA